MSIELDVHFVNFGDSKKQEALGGEMGRVMSNEGGYGAERTRAVDNVDESFFIINCFAPTRWQVLADRADVIYDIAVSYGYARVAV